ncbi:MAG TPA: transcriptional regulator [Nitrosopumilaceae archaeon]|nr:transcriptional regulator [Nitrosopumilaceae archaeon]
MNYDYEKFADDFLELASQQRLGILLRLSDKKSKVSIIAKELGATVPEVYRNFERLVKSNLIVKESDGYYSITTYGKIICNQIPSLAFLSQNKKYFKDHGFGDLPQKFLQRAGALVDGQYVKGFVKVLEQWKNIYKNSDEYVCNILFEVPYDSDLLELLVKKVNKGVKVNSIFSESAIIPKDRKQLIEKLGFKKLIEQGLIERKMKENVQVVVVLNEKEACVMFPKVDGEVDVSEMFYSDNVFFHEWCFDYFKYCWSDSKVFQESKLKHE